MSTFAGYAFFPQFRQVIEFCRRNKYNIETPGVTLKNLAHGMTLDEPSCAQDITVLSST